MALQTLTADASAADISGALQQQGAVVVENVLDRAGVQRVTAEVMPFIEATPLGRDDFVGRKTQRTGALVARSPACRELVMHPGMLAAANEFLGPFTTRIILHLTQTIHINPGQGKQPLHRDRLAWGNYLPRSIEPQYNTIWALTDFTTDNGATRVVPGSNTWPDEQRAAPEEICQAEMPAGSVLVYSGSVIHSGGENRSSQSRLGLNITYCLGWLRQEENQYLSCPPHIARTLDPDLQDLLGYTQGEYALGYYSDPESTHDGIEVAPPEFIVGRKPRQRMGADDLVQGEH